MFIELFDARSSASVGRDPVAVPEKIFGLTLILGFFDRCHSLVSLPPPQAAVDSLPTGRAETRCTIIRSRRGDYQSPVALPLNNTIHRYYGTNLPLCSAARGVPFLLRQERNQSPPKKGDLGEALRLCCGNTSTFRHYPRQPKFALPQDPLPRCAKLLHDTNRFLNYSINIYLTLFQFHGRSTRKGYAASVALLRR